jgi:hypothetical protein
LDTLKSWSALLKAPATATSSSLNDAAAGAQTLFTEEKAKELVRAFLRILLRNFPKHFHKNFPVSAHSSAVCMRLQSTKQ